MEGRNPSFCFKNLHNEIKGDGNQVHTRALHAEENAFLQIVKHGGQSVIGGTLYTTSSPCELCSKKAYQLGISRIVYIEPYPGIAVTHVVRSGTKQPEMTLFSGAIGLAYSKLYEPLFPYKDELRAMYSEPQTT
jgi:deoxycytidylate deaminase